MRYHLILPITLSILPFFILGCGADEFNTWDSFEETTGNVIQSSLNDHSEKQSHPSAEEFEEYSTPPCVCPDSNGTCKLSDITKPELEVSSIPLF